MKWENVVTEEGRTLQSARFLGYQMWRAVCECGFETGVFSERNAPIVIVSVHECPEMSEALGRLMDSPMKKIPTVRKSAK